MTAMTAPSAEDVAARLARNVKQLRLARSQTQQQMAKLSGLPRATWAHIESGAANPTLTVLRRVAFALQVAIEELIAEPRVEAKHYPKGSLPARMRGEVSVRSLLPDAIAGMQIERIELPRGTRLVGVPHTPRHARVPHLRDRRDRAGRLGSELPARARRRGRLPRRSTPLLPQPQLDRRDRLLGRGPQAGRIGRMRDPSHAGSAATRHARAMNRQGAEAAKLPEPESELDAAARVVVGAAPEVHRILGPGSLE